MHRMSTRQTKHGWSRRKYILTSFPFGQFSMSNDLKKKGRIHDSIEDDKQEELDRDKPPQQINFQFQGSC